MPYVAIAPQSWPMITASDAAAERVVQRVRVGHERARLVHAVSRNLRRRVAA